MRPSEPAVVSGARTRLLAQVMATVLLLSSALSVGRVPYAWAQPAQGDWVSPANLSQSGAASSPLLLPTQDGGLRVLWWDQLDGITLADMTAEGWSEPIAATILVLQETEGAAGSQVQPTYVPIASMPYVIGNAAGQAHALWLGQPDRQTGRRALLYARLDPGSISWTLPRPAAESALGFHVAVDGRGTLHLAYIRDLETIQFPAGVYHRRSADGGATWGPATVLRASRYLRLLSPESAHLQVTATGAGTVYVTWDEPNANLVSLAQSTDGGATWTEPLALGAPAQQPRRGRIVADLEGGGLLLWEDDAVGGLCALFQVGAGEAPTGTQSTGERVLPTLAACPQRMATLHTAEQEAIVAGYVGGDTLSLLPRPGGEWADPTQLTVVFPDPASGQSVELGDLQAALLPSVPGEVTSPEPKLAVVGIDRQGDAWFVESRGSLYDLLVEPARPHGVLPPGAEPGAPRNLSRSGGASQPVLVAAPGGSVRAFWWDEFDGIRTVDGTLLVARVVSGTEEFQQDYQLWSEPRTSAVTAGGVPRFVGAGGRLHAFWLEGAPAAGEAARVSLLHSWLIDDPLSAGPGDGAWSQPAVLGHDVVAYAAATDSAGEVHVAYLSTQAAGDLLAGLYYRRTLRSGLAWADPVVLEGSPYYRLLLVEDAHVALAVTGAGTVTVSWDEPQRAGAMLAQSPDSGTTWGEAQSVRDLLADAEARPQRGRLAALPDDHTLLLWEDERSGCRLYQSTVSELPEGGAAANAQALDAFTTCLGEARFEPLGERVLLIASEDEYTLRVALWEEGRWSAPQRLDVGFRDPDTGAPVYLSAPHATLVEMPGLQGAESAWVLAAVAVDMQGDVWARTIPIDELEIEPDAPPPWSLPAPVSEGGQAPGLPVALIDAEGRVHVLWSEADASGGPGTAFFYARQVGSGTSARWTRPDVILRSPQGKAEELDVAALDDELYGRLYAAWSGGFNGEIYLSGAFLHEANLAAAWSEPVRVQGGDSSVAQAGSWPHLEVDALGRLHVLYAVPLNEGRGIYYARSDDDGASWTAPYQLLDATAAGWAMADTPRLAVEGAAVLHAAWVRAPFPGDGPPLGVFYARSADGGATWSEPDRVAEGAYAWPDVLITGPGQVHFLWAEIGEVTRWWHTWSEDSGATWTRPERVPGLDTHGRAGIAADGAGTLYLVGLALDEAGNAMLRYTTWHDRAWERHEASYLGLARVEPGVALALAPRLGRLAAFLRGGIQDGANGTAIGVLHLERAIPLVEPLPALGATSRPGEDVRITPEPTPAATMASPERTTVATLDLSPGGLDGDEGLEGLLPLLLGGGLAVLIVAGALGARLAVAAKR